MQACRDGTPYRIGAVLDDDGLHGAMLAVEQINADGGIDGRRLEISSRGEAGSTRARVAIQAAEHLAADPAVLAIVGHTNSSASLAASQVYNALHVVQIAPTSSSPLYSTAGPYSFRLVGSDEHQGVFLANEIISHYRASRIAIVFVNDDYGRPLRGLVVTRLRAAGIIPVAEVPYVSDGSPTEHAELVAPVRDSRPDVLLWIGRARDFGPVRATIRDAAPALHIIASDGFDSGGVGGNQELLGEFTGVRYVRLVDHRRTDPAFLRLRARHERDGRGEPSDQAILSYDAVLLLAEAIRRAGPDREAIRSFLSQVGRGGPAFAGVSGPIAFQGVGDRIPQYFLEEIGAARQGRAVSPPP